jgi:hypothetical protein
VKKALSILLSSLIFFNSIGYILLYIERLANNKREMFAMINSVKDLSAVEMLIFNHDELTQKINWKSENEFEFKGKMYDVIKTESAANKVIVYCIWDEKEDELISNFEKQCNSNYSKDKINIPHRSVNTVNLIAVKNDLLKSERINSAKFLSETYFNYYHSISKKTLTPPPKFL